MLKTRLDYDGDGNLLYVGNLLKKMDGTVVYSIFKLGYENNKLAYVTTPIIDTWEKRTSLDWG